MAHRSFFVSVRCIDVPIYRFDKLGFVDLISTNFYKVEVDCRLVFIIKLPIAAPQCLKAFLGERGNGLRSKTHEPALVQAPARLRANVPSN